MRATKRPRSILLSMRNIHTPSDSGITLIELLVSLAISAILLTGTVVAVTSYWRYSARVEAINRLQDRWSQVNFLLSTEISEASTFGDDGSCDGADSLLTLNVPSEDSSDNLAPIRYAVDDADNLLRCGPAVSPDGSLIFDNITETSALVPNAAMTVDLGTGLTPSYTLTLTDPATGTSYQNQVSGSRARVRTIN